ncbi:MAG: hypothetical protein IKB78_00430 [Clostridia bacterium]|nr:hypothetical protein [Clostridia bacterium]
MFQVSPLFGDHAILPLGKELRIFGMADEGECIHARLTAGDGTVTGEGRATGRDGRFLLHLPPQRLGAGPLTLTLTSPSKTCTFTGLQVGFLFMAGGQSNMELALWNAQGGQELIRHHEDPDLRYINIPRVSVLDESALEQHRGARWQTIAPHQGGDMSAVAYFFATQLRTKIGFPVGIIGCNWGGTSILSWMDETALGRCSAAARSAEAYEKQHGHVTIEQWKERQAVFQHDMDEWNAAVARVKEANPGIEWSQVEAQTGPCPWNPPPGPGSPYRPGQLAKCMVDFVAPAALTAMLYYQGESDVDRAEDYGELLITLVNRWREIFRDAELPFYNVQLPMFIDAGAEDDHRWAILRSQQEKAWHALRNSHLAVLLDRGEYGNIHPVDKHTPGQRLARLFMEEFTHTQPAQPWPLRKSTKGNVLTVELTCPVQALEGKADLFEIAGEDGVYHPADVEIDWSKLHLSAPGVPHPVKARYAWVNYAKVRVFSVYKALPLAPFVLE